MPGDDAAGLRLALSDREVELSTGAVFRGEERLARLGGRELALLRYLAQHPSRLVHRDELYRAVWGHEGAWTRAADHAVSRLRGRIEAEPGSPRHLVTVFGEGYRFEPSAAVAAPAALPPPAETPVALGDRWLDLARHRVTGPDGAAPLSGNEVALLRCLVAARGAVVERGALRRALRITDRALDNAVSRLRGKLEADPARPRHLRTAKAGGYQLELDGGADLPELLGRDELLAEARAALAASAWVVLVGAGGAGKTSLARRLAAERSAVWVDLAAAGTGDEAAAAVAAALGLAGGAHAVEGVATSSRRGLVVLDNLEPLGDAVLPLLRAWVRPGGGLRWLGTSRVRPGHDGEVALEVGPLSEAAAIELFVTRARAAARFEPEGSRAAVAALVSRLDGLPLAIELAAARVGVLPPEEQLTRLDRRLQWLQRPSAGVERHRSLRAVLDGSWELLSEADARLLAVLACFTGPFDAPDAEGAGGPDALDGLQRLRDHSLVHAHRAGGLALYESIRQYVAERRGAAPDGGRAAELAFVAWMARWGAPAHLERLWHRGHEGPTAAHERSADDLLAAVDLALRWGEVDAAVRCAVAAAHVRRRTGPYGPSLARLDAVLAAGGEAPEVRWLLAELLVEADRPDDALAGLAGEPPAGGELRGRWFGVRARARLDRGEMEGGIADLGVAVEALAEVRPDLAAWHRARRIVLSHAVGSPVGSGDEALASYQRAEDLAHRRGDELLSALALHQLARFDQANGRPTLAADRFRETRRRFLEARSRPRALGASTDLLLLLALSGDAEGHEGVGAAAVEEARELGLRVDEATAWVYVATGRYVRGEDGPGREAATAARAVMAQTRPLPRGLGYLELREAERAARRGDGGSALALAASARARFEALQDVANQARADVAAALGLTAAGRPADALRHAEDAVPQLTTYDRPPALVARGLAKLALGDRAGAEGDLAEAEAEARSSGFTDPRSECGRALDWLRETLRVRESG